MAEEKKIEKLLTSKKKLETGKWGYRGFVVEKSGAKWVAKLPEGSKIPEDKSDSIVDELMTSAKNICLKIDSILGPLTEAEQVKPVRKAKSKAERLKEKEEKSRYLERAQRVAYDIRNSINVLSCLKQKSFTDKFTGNEVMSTAPNMRKSLKNGFKIGWESGCLYDIPEITDDVVKIVEKDKEIIEEFRNKHEDLNIEFRVNDTLIDIEVTYKE